MDDLQAFETFDTAGLSSNGFPSLTSMAAYDMFKHSEKLPPHSSHPNFGHLSLLVFQAVLEVVFVALPGYIVARQGMFDANAQKFAANLNVQLFTPCLIFYKLSSQLRREDLPGLALIPLIFAIQTIVSYLCARFVSWFCGFKKRGRNFVIAMAVFGNSNSLPISLVTSLAFTIKGLHWDKEPHDTDSSVSSRGITYLVLFQQLGQLLRWSWGYRVLLMPPENYTDDEVDDSERSDARVEQGGYRDYEPSSSTGLLVDVSDHGSNSSDTETDPTDQPLSKVPSRTNFDSGAATPMNRKKYAVSASSCSCDSECIVDTHYSQNPNLMPTPANGNSVRYGPGNLAGHDEVSNGHSHGNGHFKSHWPRETFPSGPKGWYMRVVSYTKSALNTVGDKIYSVWLWFFHLLPRPIQRFLISFGSAIWENLNPPLLAMVAALPVVLIPQLKHLFYEVEFVEHSLTRAIKQSGDVAVPLIIVVLGANLARNTLPEDQQNSDDPKLSKKLLIASLTARMLLPMLVMAPILALTARFLPVNILGDPIFIIVCYLLAGAPSALQLAQICQINNVYLGVMTKLLFQSYVVWIMPSTLILVMLALETLEWAQAAR